MPKCKQEGGMNWFEIMSFFGYDLDKVGQFVKGITECADTDRRHIAKHNRRPLRNDLEDNP